MAKNPITSEGLTVDFKQLMSIPVGSRVQAASLDNNFLASVLTLTPSQIAQAFPDYYKRSLPDVSNFITANIQAKLSGRGRTWDQTGGGAPGTTPGSLYTQEGRLDPRARPKGAPKPTVDEMKKELAKAGINVDNVYNIIDEKGVLAGDKRIQFLKNLSKEDLAKAGLEKVETEDGKSLIRETATQASQMSDEQIVSEIKKKSSNEEGTYRPVYSLSEIDLSDAVINTIAGEALAGNKESIDGVINNMLNRVGADPNWNNLKDVARAPKQYAGYRVASDEQAAFIRDRIKELSSGKVSSNIGAATEFRAEYYVKGEGYGKTFEREARKQGYLQPGPGDNIYAETFAAGPYAPRKQEEVEKIKTENAAKMNKSYTPEEIKEAKQNFIQEEQARRQALLTESLYQQGSPTSSEYIQDPNDPRTSTVLDSRVVEEQAGFRKLPIKPELKNSLDYAAEMSGIEVEVFSGGQDHQIHDQMEAAGQKSSYRHNIDIPGTPGAADVVLYYRDENDRKIPLSVTNPEHASKISTFTENFSRVVPSAGVGSNYMKTGGYIDPTKIHYGGPNNPGENATTWGNMPDYMREAHQKGVELRNEDIKNDRDPLKEWIIKKEEEREKKKIADNPTSLPTPVETTAEVPKLALGGSLHGLNEDMTLVDNTSGQPIAQIGQNERFEKQGNAIQVTPETKLKADELTDKYDISDDMETQISEVEERLMQQQQQNNQMNQKPREPDRIKNEPESNWHEMSAQISPLAAPYERAIARAKFLPEGYHYGRGMHSSVT